jgi:hypothetical protein
LPLPTNLGEIALSEGGEAIAFAAGFALARVLEPAAVTLSQDAWRIAPIRAVDPTTAAEIVAEDVEQREWGAAEAVQGGIDGERFDAIVGEVLNAPGMGELYAAYRRGLISSADFSHGLRKAKLETRWDEAMEALKEERLGPDVIARAIQRGLIRDPGLLPVPPPTAEGRVAAFPVFDVDALTEAAAFGIDRDRLGVEVGLVGNPASPQQAAAGVFRGVLELADFQRAIAEGNTRNEWADAILEVSRAILTPHEYEEAALRGIITNEQADAGAGKHGMAPADAQLLFQIMGRPLAVHQITTGLARGGDYGGTYDDVPEPYRDAIRRSSIRPEYAKLAFANRYTYPSAFVLRALAQSGELDEQTTEKILLDIGWPPDLAAKVAPLWAGGGAGKGDPHVGKAETQLWGALHKAYVNDEASDALAHSTLTTIGVAAAAQAQVLALWQAERALVRATLTAAQIKKAVTGNLENQAWATERLKQLGYSDADAATFLAE